MSLDNTFGVKRSYAALEPKTAADKYEAEVNTVKGKMANAKVEDAYKAMFQDKKKLAKTLRLLSSSGLPGKKVTGPSLIVNPDNYSDAGTFATACKQNHDDIKKHLDEKGGAFGAYHINREAMSADLMNSLVKWYNSLALGEGGMIAALSVFDPSVRSATEAKPEENIKTKEQIVAENAEAAEKKLFMEGKHGELKGKLGPLKSSFLKRLKSYNEDKSADYKIGKVKYFSVYQDSSSTRSMFDIDSEPTDIRTKVRRLAVLAADSNGNVVIMAENDDRSDVDGPEAYNRETLAQDNTITHRVERKGNEKYQESLETKRQEELAQQTKDQTLTEFKGVILNLDSNLANRIAEIALKLVKKYDSEKDLNYVLSNFRVTNGIDAKAQRKSGPTGVKAERTNPGNYDDITIYMVTANNNKAIIPVTYNQVNETLRASKKILPIARTSMYVNLSGKYLYRTDNNELSKVAGVGELKGSVVKDIK